MRKIGLIFLILVCLVSVCQAAPVTRTESSKMASRMVLYQLAQARLEVAWRSGEDVNFKPSFQSYWRTIALAADNLFLNRLEGNSIRSEAGGMLRLNRYWVMDCGKALFEEELWQDYGWQEGSGFSPGRSRLLGVLGLSAEENEFYYNREAGYRWLGRRALLPVIKEIKYQPYEGREYLLCVVDKGGAEEVLLIELRPGPVSTSSALRYSLGRIINKGAWQDYPKG